MVSITLRVLSRPDIEHLPMIYKSLGLDYDERVLPSIGNEVLKSIVAQFDAAELITQREVVRPTLYMWGLCSVIYLNVCKGIVTNSRGPPPAGGRVQHHTRRCFHYSSHIRQGEFPLA